MSARSIDTATIAFGLVAIPVKIYSTKQPSRELHFHFVHAGCGERLKQQYVCPAHGKVDRSEMVKGFEITRGKVVELEKAELAALEAVATDEIAVAEFVPAAAVDPIFIEASYYLGPDKGGDRGYRLFRDAIEDSGLVSIASYAARGKQYTVMIRPFEDGLVMHQLRYPDEIKPWSEIPIGELPKAASAELGLARRVIEQIEHAAFDPSRYKDEVKGRVRALIAEKAKTGEITIPESAPAKPEVMDLMAALEASLGRKPTAKRNGEARRAARGHGARGTHATRKRHAKRDPHASRRQRPASRRAASRQRASHAHR